MTNVAAIGELLRTAITPDGTLSLRVIPGARTTSAEKRGETIVLRIRAPAIDGRANDAVLDLLAETLGIRQSAITLTHGAASRTKRFRITR